MKETRPIEAKTDGAKALSVPTFKVGNLTRDPELRRSDSGVDYVITGLAVDVPVAVEGSDEVERETKFYNLVCFGTLAEHVATSLRKGARVIVTGKVELRTWEDDEGATRMVERIVVDAMGPELRWATAKVTRQRTKATSS